MSATQKKWKGTIVGNDISSISGGLIISIKEARKVLGKDAESLSDDDLIKVIVSFSKISNGIFDAICSK
jgi:hypothetical protein